MVTDKKKRQFKVKSQVESGWYMISKVKLVLCRLYDKKMICTSLLFVSSADIFFVVVHNNTKHNFPQQNCGQ